jgi:hypothetical protein
MNNRLQELESREKDQVCSAFFQMITYISNHILETFNYAHN